MSDSPQSNRTLTIEFLFDTEENCDDAFSELSHVSPYNIVYLLQINLGVEKVLISQDGVYLDRLVNRRYDEPEQSPLTYSRQEVLCEEWKAATDEPCFIIDSSDKIWDFSAYTLMDGKKIPNRYWSACLSFNHPIVFAPTHELAEEIVKIRKGEWRPKEGDRVWFCGNGNPPVDKFLVIPKNYDNQVWSDGDETAYIHIFPSAKQRDAFIEKNKPPQKPVTPQPELSLYSGIPIASFLHNLTLRDLIKLIDEERYQMQLDEVRTIQEKGSTDSK